MPKPDRTANTVGAYYRCNKCHRTYWRGSHRWWIKSYCKKAGDNARLYRVRVEEVKP
jgi:uncharacterized protein with PIN domain